MQLHNHAKWSMGNQPALHIAHTFKYHDYYWQLSAASLTYYKSTWWHHRYCSNNDTVIMRTSISSRNWADVVYPSSWHTPAVATLYNKTKQHTETHTISCTRLIWYRKKGVIRIDPHQDGPIEGHKVLWAVCRSNHLQQDQKEVNQLPNEQEPQCAQLHQTCKCTGEGR